MTLQNKSMILTSMKLQEKQNLVKRIYIFDMSVVIQCKILAFICKSFNHEDEKEIAINNKGINLM